MISIPQELVPITMIANLSHSPRPRRRPDASLERFAAPDDGA